MQLFDALYFGITGSTLLALGAAMMRNQLLSFWLGGVVFLTSLTTLSLISFKAGRPPIYGHFEIIIQISLMLSVFALWQLHSSGNRSTVPATVAGAWMVSLLLLGILYFYPKTINSDFYMYNRAVVLAFFNFRISAAAFFLMAGIQICAGLFSAGRTEAVAKPLQLGRELLLLGTICFLVSECAGSFWCLQWWGDSWHWSKGFLKAACAFMGVMLTFHIPANWRLAKPLWTVAGCVPGLGSLWLLLLH